MQSYKRKITYFYQFHNGNVGSTAGFLKLEIRGDKVKIIINIQEPPGLPYKSAVLYFYHEAGDHLAAIKVDEIESIGDMLTYQTRTDWQQLFDTGRDLYTFDGVAVVYNDYHYYIGDFQDKNRKDYALVRKENRKPAVMEPIELFAAPDSMPVKEAEIGHFLKDKSKSSDVKQVSKAKADNNVNGLKAKAEEEEEAAEKPIGKEAVDLSENMAVQSGAAKEGSEENDIISASEMRDEKRVVPEEPVKNVFEKCESCPYHRKRMEQKEEEDACEKMLTEYPKLPIYGATELFNCVRIHPKDIGKLDMRNWKLGVNSFLTHGFYTYQYLLLGKMRFDDGSERSIIGVPGVFSNREKYLANMFGFEQFIPVKKTGIKTGEFGYWIVEISSGL